MVSAIYSKHSLNNLRNALDVSNGIIISQNVKPDLVLVSKLVYRINTAPVKMNNKTKSKSLTQNKMCSDHLQLTFAKLT